MLAGSSGRVDTARAHLSAPQGVVAESIQWSCGPGQHDGTREIPIELFVQRVEALMKVCDRVILLGTSFGAEAGLLAGADSPIQSRAGRTDPGPFLSPALVRDSLAWPHMRPSRRRGSWAGCGSSATTNGD